jgi:hypothetical protein
MTGVIGALKQQKNAHRGVFLLRGLKSMFYGVAVGKK